MSSPLASGIVVRPPWTREEIVAELRRVHDASGQFWDRFSPDQFVQPIGDAWSPADNVRHLLKAVKPVAAALRLPGPLLVLLFGRSKARSSNYATIVERYHGVLEGGGKAGRFAPSPLALDGDLEAWRRGLMRRRQALADVLEAAVRSRSERSLDRLRLPHPLMGKLTLREMLFFTLYHGLHHVENVARRLSLSPGK